MHFLMRTINVAVAIIVIASVVVAELNNINLSDKGEDAHERVSRDSGTCDNLNWSYNENTYTLTISGAGSIECGASGNTKPQWSKYMYNISRIIIEEGVSEVGDYVFRYHSNLTNVTIPSTVTHVGNHAFASCTKLRFFPNLPNGTSFEPYTFQGCSSLESFTFPYGMTEIPHTSFEGCISLKSVSFPPTLELIRADAFKGCKCLESLLLPPSLTKILKGAFEGCSSIKYISVPASLNELGGDTCLFSSSNLKYINVADGNSIFKSIDGVLYDPTGTNLIRYPCKKSNNYTIPDGVEGVDNGSFNGCNEIESLTIPSSLTSMSIISSSTFSNLASINVRDGNPQYKSIDEALFDSTGTTLIRYPCRKTTNYSIPEGVTIIGQKSFQGCDGLESLSIPSTLTSVIVDDTMIPWDNLESVAVNENNPVYKFIDDALIINEGTKLIHYKCGKPNYTIPSSVTTVAAKVFSGCSNLEYIDVDSSNTVYTSKDGVLYDRAGKTLIKYACGKSVNYTISNTTTVIADYAFYKRDNLISVIIPSSVTSIGKYSFAKCNNLKAVIYYGTNDVQYSSENPFTSCPLYSFTCVPLKYGSDFFCQHKYLKSDSCEEVLSHINLCYDIIIDSDITYHLEKIKKAKEWEDRTNGCSDYSCDNESGLIFENKCFTGRTNTICMNDACHSEKEVFDGKGIIVVLETQGLNHEDLPIPDIPKDVSEILGIDVDRVQIGIEIDIKGEVKRVFIVVDDADIAETLVRIIEDCSDYAF